MIIRKLDEVKTVEWGNGLSRRFLLEADGMGYTVTDTIVRAGTKSRLEYKNHLEACYCIEGKGSVIELDGTEHEIVPGTIYALDKHDAHDLCAAPDQDLRLVCMFTPALIGDEAHRLTESGIHSSVYSKEPRMALTATTGDWTDEQKALRKSLDQYFDALNEGHIEDDAANRFNRDKWELIRQSGVLRIPFDQQWGGLGHDVLTLVYVLENLGYGCRDVGLLFGAATQIVSAAIPLQKFGSDELKERYLARLIDGEILSAHAISEPSAGSDAMAMITTATEDGDDYILDGKKIWITSGPLADVITVYAKMDTGGGAAGITAFMVPTDTPGFNVGEPIEKLGLNTCPFCELEFRDCRVPKENILGRPGSGFFILEHVMNYEILCIFMMMVGEMQERMERCIKWAKTRQAFDRPIGANQYVAGKIVDQKIGLENSRKHLYDTARRFVKGRNVTTEISMAKLVTSEANLASALSAVQIFGARGYTREYGLEKGLRDAVGAPIYSGTNETQRVRIASMLGL